MSRYAESYKRDNLAGPGDARPSALQIINDEDLINKLTDKTFVVTGVSSGIGIETLRALHATGAHVLGTVRSVQKGQQVADEILSSDKNGGKITLIEMDLESLESVRKAAAEILEKSGGKINGIINNAGIMAVPNAKTKDGFERQFGTNHLGHFLLFELLKDALLKNATPEYPTRVISVTSIGHKFGTPNFDDYNFENTKYDPFGSYGQSKTANIWFANYVDRNFASQNLRAVSCHPGGVHSNLASNLDMENIDPELVKAFMSEELKKYYKTPGQGAATQVYALVSKEWKDKGGKYLSDCVEQPVYGSQGLHPMLDDGYAPHAYDPAGEDRLWKDSLKLVGLSQ